MPRKPQVRISYQNDAAYFVRLSQAVEDDNKRSSKWKKKVLGHLNALSLIFLEDEKKRVGKKA
jgi:hypothetical protein